MTSAFPIRGSESLSMTQERLRKKPSLVREGEEALRRLIIYGERKEVCVISGRRCGQWKEGGVVSGRREVWSVEGRCGQWKEGGEVSGRREVWSVERRCGQWKEGGVVSGRREVWSKEMKGGGQWKEGGVVKGNEGWVHIGGIQWYR